MENLYVHDTRIHNKIAPQIILPHIFKLISVNSVVDVGCGLATWISVCEDLGVTDVMGIDGDYVDLSLLAVEKASFVSADLRMPISLNRRFDLAICLEVAEHLPLESADNLIDTLTNHSDNILFSAALPNQDGQNHINEQPFEFWEAKFNAKGYFFADVIRPIFWNDSRVDWWYRQNIFLVTKKRSLEFPAGRIGTAYHPEKIKLVYEERERLENATRELSLKFTGGNISIKEASKILVKSVINAFKRKKA